MPEGGKEDILQMEDVLHKEVIGQDKARIAIANPIRRSCAGFSDAHKSMRWLIFLGPPREKN
jgi:ATP-dependent Clp protease ATP-binding subunit ClpB